MDIHDYRRLFHDNNNSISIGEGLVSVHNSNESFVINYKGDKVLQLDPKEYCINCKNNFFLLFKFDEKNGYHLKKENWFYIIDENKQLVKRIETYRLFISQLKDYYVIHNEDTINFINYKGVIVSSFEREEGLYYFQGISQLPPSVFSIIFESNLSQEVSKVSSKFLNSVIFNIDTNKIIVKGESYYCEWYERIYDATLIGNAALFHLPLQSGDLRDEWLTVDGRNHILLDVIKYIKVEVDNENDLAKYSTLLCDFYGNIVKEFDYTDIEFHKGYYITQKKDEKETYYGLLDSSLIQILPCCFPDLKFEKDIIVIEQSYGHEKENYVLDLGSKRFKVSLSDGTDILLPYLYFSCNGKVSDNVPDLYFACRMNDKGERMEGIISKEGEVVVEAEFSRMYLFTSTLIIGVAADNEKSKTTFSIKEGRVECLNHYKEVTHGESENYFRVRKKGDDGIKSLFGFINDKGDEIIPLMYEYINFPKYGKVVFIKDGKPGWIDLRDLSEHIYPKFAEIKSFYKNQAIFCIGERSIKCMRNDRYYTGWDEYSNSPIYSPIRIEDPYNGEPTLVYRGEILKGIMNIYGEIVAKAEYEEIKYFKNLFLVRKEGMWGMLNNEGEIIIPIEFTSYRIVDRYHNEVICKESRIAFINGNNQVLFYNEACEMVLKTSMAELIREYESVEDLFVENYDEEDDSYALGEDAYTGFFENPKV